MSTTSQPQKFTGHLFVGKYKLVSEEDVDDYLKALGIIIISQLSLFLLIRVNRY